MDFHKGQEVIISKKIYIPFLRGVKGRVQHADNNTNYNWVVSIHMNDIGYKGFGLMHVVLHEYYLESYFSDKSWHPFAWLINKILNLL